MRTLTPLFVGTLISALVALPAFAAGYRVDFDSIQTGAGELSGGTLVLQGGLTPVFTHGAASGYEEYPLVASGTCGNDVKEAGEACDGTDMGGNACTSFGFASGTLSCNADCSADTSACVAASSTSTASSSAPTGGGHGTGIRPTPTPGASTESSPRGDTTHPAGSDQPGGSDVTDFEQPSSSSPLPIVASSSSEIAASSEGDSSSIVTIRSSIASTSSRNADGSTHAAASTTSPIASAAGLGSITLAEAGILARLGWMSRVKELYDTIPAFLS